MGLSGCNPIVSQGASVFILYKQRLSEAGVRKTADSIKMSYSHSQSTYPNPNLPSNPKTASPIPNLK